GRGQERLSDLLEVAAGVAEGRRQLVDQCRRGLVGYKVADELGGDVLGGRLVQRKVAEHGPALLNGGVVIYLADDRLRSGLVQTPVERELTTMLGVVAGGQEGPAGGHLCEANDVVLGGDGTHPQRVEPQDFAARV